MHKIAPMDSSDCDDREISESDILKGLRIAAAAAGDEEVDARFRHKTGLRIRRYLADLLMHDLALKKEEQQSRPHDDEQRARRRRMEMRKLKQQLRRSRVLSTDVESTS